MAAASPLTAFCARLATLGFRVEEQAGALRIKEGEREVCVLTDHSSTHKLTQIFCLYMALDTARVPLEGMDRSVDPSDFFIEEREFDLSGFIEGAITGIDASQYSPRFALPFFEDEEGLPVLQYVRETPAVDGDSQDTLILFPTPPQRATSCDDSRGPSRNGAGWQWEELSLESRASSIEPIR